MLYNTVFSDAGINGVFVPSPSRTPSTGKEKALCMNWDNVGSQLSNVTCCKKLCSENEENDLMVSDWLELQFFDNGFFLLCP